MEEAEAARGSGPLVGVFMLPEPSLILFDDTMFAPQFPLAFPL
jgi:hypothetical protein